MTLSRLRNFVMRLSINYILFTLVLLLPGISSEPKLFDVWVIASVFTALSVSLRRILITLALPLIIMTGGLFVLVVDVTLLALTAALTRLNVRNFGWSLLGVIVMSSASIWVERAFRELGWLSDGEPGRPDILTRSSPPWWLKLTLFALLLAGIAFSAAMGAQLFLLMSQVSTSVVINTVVACLGFVMVSWAIGWLVAQGLALVRRARFSVVVAIVATVLVAIPAGYTVVTAPHVAPAPPKEPRTTTDYWTLSTGSTIAYTHIPAGTASASSNPIVFLHGLGEAVLDSDIAFFGQVSQAGYDVYLYDMAGSGCSEVLESITSYTIARHAEDLEHIREIIDGDRLVLVGHAEGARVAAQYTVEHRDRVERLIFYAPEALVDPQYATPDLSQTAASPASVLGSLEVRPWIATAMAYFSPEAAEVYASQSEIRSWSDRTADPGANVCIGRREAAPQLGSPGYNAYVEIVGERSLQELDDPRPELASILIPALLIRGECDWVDPAVVSQYRDAMPYLQIVRIQDAGHMPHLEKPEVVLEAILGFLRDAEAEALGGTGLEPVASSV